MLERKYFMPINYLKKEAFTGSFHQMRFREEKKEGDDGTLLLVTCWPQPYCFDATPEEQKTAKTFSFTEEGLCESISWLRKMYDSHFKTQSDPDLLH